MGCRSAAQIPIEHAPNAHNEGYLRTKAQRMGHTLHHQGLNLDEEMLDSERKHDRHEGLNEAVSGSFAIAISRFYEDLAERLLSGAKAAFAECGSSRHRGVRRAGRVRAAAGRELCGQLGALLRAWPASAR